MSKATLTLWSILTKTRAIAPRPDEVEVSLFGPGKGESCLVHIGNGKWMLVDSCRDQKTGLIPPVEYLDKMDVDIETDLILIVATHAHNDHFAGIAEVFDRASSAKMAVSMALCKEEFHALLQHDEILAQRFGLRTSAYSEYRRLHEIAKQRFERTGSKLVRAVESRLLLELPSGTDAADFSVEVRALSPSDAAIDNATRKFLSAYPPIGGQIGVSRIDPNECSIALRVQIGEIVVLLGADLLTGPPGCGWEAVLATAPANPASLFKVPHHGSETSHHPRVWSEMLSPNPVALVAPFRAGRKRLPAPTDLERISEFTDQIFLTADPQLPAESKRVRTSAEKILTLASDVRDVWGMAGRITARRVIGSTQWRTSTQPPAYALSQHGRSTGRTR